VVSLPKVFICLQVDIWFFLISANIFIRWNIGNATKIRNWEKNYVGRIVAEGAKN
jgi:hypothetical protein